MASYTYTYPRVDITTTALSRPVLTENVPDTLVLFAPFKAELGPVNQIVVCHTRSEFEETFGQIDYSIQGQNGLNILHWLSNGGTVYAARLATPDDNTYNKPASATVTDSSDNELFTVKTKNPGQGYNNFKIKVTAYTSKSLMVYIYSGSLLMERFTVDATSIIELKSEVNTVSSQVYFTFTNETAQLAKIFDSDTGALIRGFELNVEVSVNALSFTGGATESTTQDELIYNALSNIDEIDPDTGHPVFKLLKDSLQYPIDVMLDAGFESATKTAMWNAFNSPATESTHIRNDVFVYYDQYEFDGSSIQPVKSTFETNDKRSDANSHNAAIYQQFYKVKDGYVNSQIFVTPSYFISTMLPYHTIMLNKGYHTPIAGLTNGELTGVLYVNENPIPETKETWFTNRINYSEKDSRQISFMSQRTLESADKNTALQFANNALMTNKIVKELGTLAREYLFEYNDAITLANIRKTLNVYISNYVAARVLQYAVIDVQKNPFSEEAIDISINIKYTGTIEVISIDLTIE